MARLSASKPTAFDASDAYTWLIMHDCVLHDLAIKDMGLWLRGLGRSRLGLGVIVVCMGMPEVGVSEFIAFVFVWFCCGIEQNDTPLPMQGSAMVGFCKGCLQWLALVCVTAGY